MEQEPTITTPVTPVDSVTEEKKKNNFQTAADAGRKGLEVTGRFLTKMLDFADGIDRWFQLHGGKLKWFIGLSFGVVVVAPLIDTLRGDWRDRWTAWSTVFLLIFLFVMLLAWLGSLRDDEGNWSLKRVWSSIWTNIQININFIIDGFNLPKEELFYRLSTYLMLGSFGWKALQNVSVLVRKFYESTFHTKWQALRTFERTTNQWTPWVFFLGLAILLFLIYKNKTIWKNLVQDFLPFLASTKEYKIDNSTLKLSSSNLVINAKDKDQVSMMLNGKHPELFNDFIKAIQKWTPKSFDSEFEFENNLKAHLKRNIPHSSVSTQYRIIVDPADKRKDFKADVVINDTILIEIKKDNVSSSTKYVFDQVYKYSDLWKDAGPVVLLFCYGDYEKVKADFVPRLTLLGKDDKKVIAFVARPR
jgi:hypothetical protein